MHSVKASFAKSSEPIGSSKQRCDSALANVATQSKEHSNAPQGAAHVLKSGLCCAHALAHGSRCLREALLLTRRYRPRRPTDSE